MNLFSSDAVEHEQTGTSISFRVVRIDTDIFSTLHVNHKTKGNAERDESGRVITTCVEKGKGRARRGWGNTLSQGYPSK